MSSQKYSLNPIQNNIFKTYKAEFILLLVTFSWGLTFPLMKLSLGFISSGLFLFIRCSITFLIFYFVFRSRLDLSVYSKWSKGIVLGIFLFLGFAFQTFGLKFTTASKSAFITGTSLILIPFAQYFIMRTKPKIENLVGAIVVMIGLYILSDEYFNQTNTGDVLTLIAALSFAIYVVLLNKFSNEANFYYLTFGQFLTMAVLSLVYMLLVEIFLSNEIAFHWNSTLVFTLLYVSIVATFISILLITKYQFQTTPVRAGIIYNMESLFAVLFAFIILDEILNFNQTVGAIIMITGLVISEFYSIIKIRLAGGNTN